MPVILKIERKDSIDKYGLNRFKPFRVGEYPK